MPVSRQSTRFREARSRSGRRRLRGLVAAVACLAMLLSAAGTANAAPPRFTWGGTDCGVIEQTGLGGVGFATDFPRVYAANATRWRDKQIAYLYTEFYELSSDRSRWLFATSTTYRAPVSDNNYAIVWQDVSNGRVMHFPYERQQFVVQRSGIYRLRQRLVWKRNGAVPGYHTDWRWLRHTGPNSESDGSTSLCFIR
jgi:hypothetical protein